MKLEVPVFNEDGSVKFTVNCEEKQAQVLLQFALNFLVATGMYAAQTAGEIEDDIAEHGKQMELPLQ